MAAWREVALGVAAVWLPGCAVMASNSVPADGAENARPAQRAGVVRAGPDEAAVLALLKDAVREDALRVWTGLPRPQLQVQLQVRAEAVTWPDGSLGCPQPGQAYTQALVPGWRLVVQGPSREAVYHASQRGQWLLCPGGPTPPVRPGDVTR